MATGGMRTLIYADETYYEVHTFASSGELYFIRKPAARTVEVLVVGGGGAATSTAAARADMSTIRSLF